MDRLKFRLAITTLAAVVALAFWGRVRAADNMCNTAGWNCTTQQDWERGWGAARQPENSGAVPTQTEYTSGGQPIRQAGEGNEINRSREAYEDSQQRPWDPMNKTYTPDSGTGGSGDFGDRRGVWGEYGRACQGSSGINARIGDTSGVCTGTVKIYSCSPAQVTTRPGESAPICLNPVGETTGSVDCVAEANRRCAFVQLDVQTGNPLSGSAITCYPTDYSRCGAAAVSGGRPSVTVTGNGGGGGGSTPMPKVPKKTPKPTPTPTPTSTPTPTGSPTPTPTPIPTPTPTPTPTPPQVLGVSAPPQAPEAGLTTNLTVGLVLVGIAGVLVRVIAVAALL